MKENTPSVIDFSIEHMDPMGQGVSKQNDKVTFIQKTLPHEKGQAEVFKKSKGVQFAKLKNLSETSIERITPECPHFDECPSCHYLHTSYEQEIQFKHTSIAKVLQPLNVAKSDIQIKEAPQRLGYRNRLQLHYKDHKYGMIDAKSNKIIEVPHCKILKSSLKESFDQIYTEPNRPTSEPKEGHVEIYENEEKVSLTWNSAYAEGGFTQVNQAMNKVLHDLIHKVGANSKPQQILDLFSGYGNLSECLVQNGSSRICVDASPKKDSLNLNYHSLNLFKDSALIKFKKMYRDKKFDLVIVDPPRKGFPFLTDWINHYQPQKLIYVSCKAATMTRDLLTIKDQYQVKQAVMLDLFPGSFHFEALIYLERT